MKWEKINMFYINSYHFGIIIFVFLLYRYKHRQFLRADPFDLQFLKEFSKYRSNCDSL